MITQEIKTNIERQLQHTRKITFLVGAGISAESGIPTFRGKDGFWTDGSRNFTPQEMGTKKMFDLSFNKVWSWYLYRISICNQAKPNLSHIELSNIEKMIPSRFALISQNVDGLHFRQESFIENLYLIHGDLRFMRCSESCSRELYDIPNSLIEKPRDRNTPILFDETQLLVCPSCGAETRPHVLWFDEYYNEYYYHLNKVLRIAKETGLLIVVGTSGATNLPKKIVKNTLARQGIVVEVNPNESMFTEHLKARKNGFYIQGKSSEVLLEMRRFFQKVLD